LSNPKSAIQLSELAEQDLEDILQYTMETWGIAQMDAYAARLQRGLQRLQDNPMLGKPRDDWFPGCRCYLVENHLALYDLADGVILVARLFHQRMDPAQHL
jgi:toxin ParE1/3/4